MSKRAKSHLIPKGESWEQPPPVGTILVTTNSDTWKLTSTINAGTRFRGLGKGTRVEVMCHTRANGKHYGPGIKVRPDDPDHVYREELFYFSYEGWHLDLTRE